MKSVNERQTFVKNKAAGFTIHSLKFLNIEPNVCQATSGHYNQNPQTRMKIELSMQEMLQNLSKEVTVDATKELLSREDTLKYIKLMEEKKNQSLAKIQVLARQTPMN